MILINKLLQNLQNKHYYDALNYNIFGYFSKFLVILTSILMINRFPLDEYGLFALYTTYSIIIIKLTNFSFEKVHIIYAIEEKEKYKVYSNIILLKFLFTLVKYLCIFLFISMIEHKLFFIVIFTIYELQTYYELNSTFFDINHEFRYKTYFNFALNSILLFWLVLLTYILKDIDLEKFIIGSLFIRIILFFLLTKKTKLEVHLSQINFSFIKKILFDGINIALIALFITLYFRIDIVMLESLHITMTDIGLYAALYKIFEGIIFISSQVRTLFFPKFIKERNTYKLYEKLKKLLLIQTILAIVVISLLILLREPLLIYALNLDMNIIESSTLLYNVIIFTIFFSFLNDSLMSFYMSKKKYKEIQIFTFSVMMINIILNFLVIPSYGIFGASISTIISEAILAILFIVFVKKFLYKNQLGEESEQKKY